MPEIAISASDIIADLGRRAKKAARLMAAADTEKKNLALSLLAESLLTNQDAIVRANSFDIEAARREGLSEAMIDRLTI